MKILRIMPSPSHLHEFRKKTNLNKESYDKQLEILKAENFMLPGGWASAMEHYGVKVFDSLYNDPVLVGKWAEENHVSQVLLSNDYFFEILKIQIKSFKPDVIFLYAGAFFWVDRNMRANIRKECGANIVLTGFWGDELPPETTYSKMFGDLDLVFSSSSIYTKHFEDAGIKVVTLGNCFDNTIAYAKSEVKREDFIFCGTTGFGYPDHIGRYEKLIKLLRHTKIKIFANEASSALGFKNRIKAALYKLFSNVPFKVWRVVRKFLPNRLQSIINISMRVRETGVDPKLIFGVSSHVNGDYFLTRKPLKKLFPSSRFNRPVLSGQDYYKLLAESNIVLNLHRDEDADIGNIRCFEVTGVGSCLLTDHGEALKEFFDTENEIVTFESIEECIEKVNFLLENPEERERIAKNGQLKTLKMHTVTHRCKVIVDVLKDHVKNQKPSIVPNVLIATYDIEKHPISFDISFFLQAAEIERKRLGADKLLIRIINPANIEHQPGISKEVDSVVDSRARLFRIFHICTQMCEMLPNAAVLSVKDRLIMEMLSPAMGNIMHYPHADVAHHSEYYRHVNNFPQLLTGFEASIEATRFIDRWLDSFVKGRKLICVTLRQYRVDEKRNSNIAAWSEFLAGLDKNIYAIAVLPDTDHIHEFHNSSLGIYPTFEAACFDVDLRFALYERSYLNMFVNNGPAVASTMNKKIRYLLFKIIEESVPHCSEDFLKWCGFELNQTPMYASEYQKWIWKNDDIDIIKKEFDSMVLRIEA